MLLESGGPLVSIINTPIYVDLVNIDLIDQPTIDFMSSMIKKLYCLGFVTSDTEYIDPSHLKLTNIGLLSASLPNMTIESKRLIFAGYQYECNISDIVTIACYLNFQESSFHAKKRDPVKWDGPDHIINNEFLVGYMLQKIFLENSYDDIRKIFDEMNVNYDSVIEMLELRDECFDALIQCGIDIFKFQDNSIAIQSNLERFMNAIHDGYLLNVCTNHGSKSSHPSSSYKSITGLSIKLGKRNVSDKFILYNSLIMNYDQRGDIYEIIPDRICPVSTHDPYLISESLVYEPLTFINLTDEQRIDYYNRLLI
jgi:hypothetical protein